MVQKPGRGLPAAVVGVYAVSNAVLDAPWPKVQTLERYLAQALAVCQQRQELVDTLLASLAEPRQAADEALACTGVSLERERLLSPAFIRIASSDSPPRVYGTLLHRGSGRAHSAGATAAVGGAQF